MAKKSDLEPANLTMSQEAELNAKAAAQEGFEQRMAFETYYKMGDKRSLRAISNKVGKSITAIENWSSKYRWASRVKERERQAAEYILMQQSAKEEAEIKKKHLTLVDATIGKWGKNLVDGNIKLQSVEDLQKLVQLRWKLASMPDKMVNQSATSQGSSIDLRLRNMDRKELNSFLYSTLKSIERVMNRPKLGGASNPEGSNERMNLDIRLSTESKQPPSPDPDVIEVDSLDVTPDDIDFDDLDID